MVNGNMCSGAWEDSLIVRLGKNGYDEALTEPHTRPADMNGRVMTGWLLVERAGIASDDKLAEWLDRAAGYANSLPPKQR